MSKRILAAEQILGGFLGFAVLIGAAAAAPAPKNPGEKPEYSLVPHRAVYEMTLDRARSGSSVAGIDGRMVFEFTGSECDGYTLNMRLVTSVTRRRGGNLITDIRTSSWEQGDGQRYRFNSSHYRNQKLVEVTAGDALRNGPNVPVAIELTRPSKRKAELPTTTLFPTQHSHVLLKAAVKGRRIVQSDVFDGSEKGDKAFATTAVIGKPYPPGSEPDISPMKKAESLKAFTSWPVLISYFDTAATGEVVPTYEMAFRLYANGVSRKLVIDYGDFVMRGQLGDIKFLQVPKCNGSGR